MKIRACIFDLDGVIVDTAKYHFQSWQKLASKLDFSFSENDNERLKGISRMDSLNIILDIAGKTFSTKEKEEFCELKNNWYRELISNIPESDILPGMRSFLNHLQSEKIKIGLGSASKNARPVLTALNLSKYFDCIVDGTNVKKSKPDPEVFTLGAELLGVSPKHTVVFEDARKGLEAALKGGFFPIGVGTPELLPEAAIHLETFEGLTIEKLQKMID